MGLFEFLQGHKFIIRGRHRGALHQQDRSLESGVDAAAPQLHCTVRIQPGNSAAHSGQVLPCLEDHLLDSAKSTPNHQTYP